MTIYICLASVTQLKHTMDSRAIHDKHRASHLHNSLSFCLAVTLPEIPINILETLSFSSLLFSM